jgi:hypothetical protein
MNHLWVTALPATFCIVDNFPTFPRACERRAFFEKPPSSLARGLETHGQDVGFAMRFTDKAAFGGL